MEWFCERRERQQATSLLRTCFGDRIRNVSPAPQPCMQRHRANMIPTHTATPWRTTDALMTPAAICLTAFRPFDWLVEGFGYQASDTLVEGCLFDGFVLISAFGFVSSAEPVFYAADRSHLHDPSHTTSCHPHLYRKLSLGHLRRDDSDVKWGILWRIQTLTTTGRGWTTATGLTNK